MAVAVFKTFLAGEVLTAADLNSSLSQIVDNGQDVPFPRTESADFDGYEIILDGDADTSITSDTDDRIDFKLRGVDLFRLDGATGGTTVNGLDFIASAAGSPVIVRGQGSDTDISIHLDPKGAGVVDLDGATLTIDADADTTLRATADDLVALRMQGADVFIFDGDEASAVDGLSFVARAAGGDVQIRAQGTSTDINVELLPKGAGILKLTGAMTMGGAVNMGGFEITNLDTIPSADAVAIGREYGMTASSITFTIADDNVVRVEGIASNSMVYVSVSGLAGSGATVHGCIYHQTNATGSTYFGGTDFAHIATSDTPPAEGGSGGTDAKVNFQTAVTGASPHLWIKNRMGVSITVRVWVMGNTYSTAALTATQL